MGLQFGHDTTANCEITATNRGGNDAIQSSDTPTTHQQPASHAANIHRYQYGRYCEADDTGGDYMTWPRRGAAGDEIPAAGNKGGATAR